MGVKYKTRPEIIEFIIQEAKNNPLLGCRKISRLIQEKFQVEISKSSINTILKTGGLSKPIGRRLIHKKRKPKLQIHIESPAPDISLPVVKEPVLLETISPAIEEEAEEKKIEGKEADKFNVPAIELPAPTVEEAEILKKVESVQPLAKNLGCWFLKAADLSLGGISAISSALSDTVKDKDTAEFISKNEALLYMPLFGVERPEDLDDSTQNALSFLLGSKPKISDLTAYLSYLKPLSSLNLVLLSEISAHMTTVSCIKFILDDNSYFFMDAYMHSIWSSRHIPKDFLGPIYKAKEYLNNSFVSANDTIVLEAPPGFELPTEAFINFIRCFKGREDKQIKCIELYGATGNLLESTFTINKAEHLFVVGLWPWQYDKVRRLECLSDFRSIIFAPTNEEFSLAEGQLVLKSPNLLDEVVLRCIVLKRAQIEVLSIVTNIKKENLPAEKIALLYLGRWPNLEAGYQDFLNKIELSGYMVNKSAASNVNSSALIDEPNPSFERILGFWRIKLNEYCQNYFFPSSYRIQDFSILKERFYELNGQTYIQNGHFKIKFNVQSEYSYLDDLIYACQRVNEKNITLSDGNKLFFEVVLP